jgi:hypothetical protein
MQLHTLLGMQAEDMLHLHLYAFDVLLKEMYYSLFLLGVYALNIVLFLV